MIDGLYYCDDCCFFCDYHDRYEVGEYVTLSSGDVVCEEAFEENCYECEECGHKGYLSEEDVINLDLGTYCCESCAERAGYVNFNGEWLDQDDVTNCDYCGKQILFEDRFEAEDGTVFYCEDCMREAGYENIDGKIVKKKQEVA